MRASIATSDRRTFFAVALLALLLAAPAIWNGFPLVMYDSGVYLGSLRAPSVPPFYALWVIASSLRVSLWLTIAAQAIGVAIWLLAFVRTVAPKARRTPVAAGAVLLSQLPWLTSWIMPDFLCGIGILSAVALLCFPTPPRAGHTIALGLGVFLSVPVASANLMVVGGTALAVLVLRRLSGAGWPLRHGVLWVFGSMALGALATLSFNTVVHGRTALNAATASMTFSRLADTGISQRHLPEICAREHFAICDHLPELDRHTRGDQDWLWGGLAKQTDAEYSGAAQYARLNREILARDPGAFVREGLVDLATLVRSPSLESNGPSFMRLGAEEWFLVQMDRYYPQSITRFQASRQQAGIVVERFPDTFYRWTTYLGYLLLLAGGAMAWLRGRRDIAIAVAVIALAVLAQLVLHAMLVGAFGRYHAKVSWIAWPCVLAWGAAEWQRRGGRQVS